MPKETSNPALHFFLYLILFFSLSFVAFGVGAILFQYVNRFFPESLLYAFQGSFDQGAVKFGIAALFVAGPIFFFSARLVDKYLFEGRIPEDSKVRRWLTYIVLFFAAGTIIGDLIALIVNFLEGDIAVRFLLKVLVILAIAGSIFEYYFWDMRRSGVVGKKYKQNRIAFWTSLAVVIVIFFSGFFIIDSPTVSRQKKIDQQTVNDIQNVDNSVRGYFAQTGNLPENLEQLRSTGFSPFTKSEGSVEYKKTGEKTFEVCADFLLSDLEQEKGRFRDEPFMEEWKHAQGKVCFERIALEQNGGKPVPER
ncbi:MAG TPA: hypothetical protein DCX32_00095 [Candidatus Moranbacteria bacterium]|nr:MAG: hypothetical protein UW95_C0015G0007 [Parcubacteria group bacterium GW2011_GWC1_45_14]HAV10938.1 hypothetical protein [Candidatus Moranbacteria bacterium]